MIISSCSKGSLLQEASKEQLSIARKRLKQFPILNGIFNNFDDYEDRHYKMRKNKVFVTCRPRLNRFNETGYPQLLEALEDSLKKFNINLRQRSSKEFINRLTSSDFYKSEGAVLEILAAYDIGRTIGFHKLSLHPKLRNCKNGDVLVMLNGRRLFLELTSLTRREATRKIEAIFDQLAEHLSSKCMAQQYYIKLFVNTQFLKKDEQGRIIEKLSASNLKSWSDRLFLHELAGLNCHKDFRNDYSTIEDKKYLSEVVGTEYESCLQPDLAETIKSQPQAQQWASKIEIKTINLCPISAVICAASSRSDLVEVQSEELYPSPAAFAQETGFHRQLTDKIKSKIEARQYDEGSPVLIMIKEDTWDRAFFDDDLEGTLMTTEIIKKELHKSVWISGVLIYDTPSHARYIENNNAHSSIKITSNDLLSMGMLSRYMPPESNDETYDASIHLK
jgi:hypothetical protein